jgi:hypothetical protein
MAQVTKEGLSPEASSRVRRAIYPCAGDDGTLPFLLFPDLEEAVLIDLHPFVHPGVFDGDAIEVLAKEPAAWVNFRELDGQRYLSRAILGAIRTQFPESRLLSVEVFETDYKTGESELYSPDGHEPMKNEDHDPVYAPRNHGIVRFQTEPKGPIRTLVYLSASIVGREPGSAEEIASPWWQSMVSTSAPQALVIKGSQEALHPEKTDSSLAHAATQLAEDRGLIVIEGRSQHSDSWEFLPEAWVEKAAQSIQLHAPFGYRDPEYGASVRVTRFEPTCGFSDLASEPKK